MTSEQWERILIIIQVVGIGICAILALVAVFCAYMAHVYGKRADACKRMLDDARIRGEEGK